MRLRRYAATLLAVSVLASAQITSGVRATFPALTSPGVTSVAGVATDRVPNPVVAPSGVTYAQANYPVYLTVQALVTGSPSTCLYHVWGTTKFRTENPVWPDDYADLSGEVDCTQPTQRLVHLAWKPVSMVVLQLTGLGGGTQPSVTFQMITAR